MCGHLRETDDDGYRYWMGGAGIVSSGMLYHTRVPSCATKNQGGDIPGALAGPTNRATGVAGEKTGGTIRAFHKSNKTKTLGIF